MSKYATGRLKKTLDSVARSIVYPEQSQQSLIDELNYWNMLNEAHIVMLFKTQLLSLNSVKKILQTTTDLRKKFFFSTYGTKNRKRSLLLI